MSVPDRFSTDPIIGWRYWYVLGLTKRLTSPIMSVFTWPLGARACADCHYHREPAPQETCSCGFYAKLRREDLSVPDGTDYVTVVLGQVSLWGKVIEHERGWKAQYAYPYALTVRMPAVTVSGEHRYQQLAASLRSAYQVDVEVEYESCKSANPPSIRS